MKSTNIVVENPFKLLPKKLTSTSRAITSNRSSQSFVRTIFCQMCNTTTNFTATTL